MSDPEEYPVIDRLIRGVELAGRLSTAAAVKALRVVRDGRRRLPGAVDEAVEAFQGALREADAAHEPEPKAPPHDPEPDPETGVLADPSFDFLDRP